MKTYITLVGLFFILLTGACAAFNYIVDPYQLYHFNIEDNDRLGRIDQFENMRFYKPQHVNMIKPRALVIGTSRSGGLHPVHSSWKMLAGYNFSMPGMTPYEIRRSIEHAQASAPLSKLVIGIDFGEFIKPFDLVRPGFEESRMARVSSDLNSPGFLWQRVKDIQASLFSFDTLMQSLEVVLQSVPRKRQFYGDGAWKSVTHKLSGRGGYLFTARSMLDLSEKGSFSSERNLATFREMLRFCYSNNIETRLFFTPTHVFIIDLWYRLGYEKLWLDLHRDIIQINEEVAHEYNQRPFEIRGFGNMRSVVDEEIYKAKNHGKAWFSDGVHFQPKLGRRIMQGLWGGGEGPGQALTPENIDNYLQSVDRVREGFFRSNGKMAAELYNKIDEKGKLGACCTP